MKYSIVIETRFDECIYVKSFNSYADALKELKKILVNDMFPSGHSFIIRKDS